MVGDTGIEPVTPSMSTKCSPAELIAHPYARSRFLASYGIMCKRSMRMDISWAFLPGFGSPETRNPHPKIRLYPCLC